MVSAAKRNRILIANSAAERSTLRKSQVVRVRRLSTANQARMLGYRFNVVSVSHSSRLRHC